jgi:hypothetical protein
MVLNSDEILIAALVVLALLAIGLIIFVVRALRRGAAPPPPKSGRAPASIEEPAESPAARTVEAQDLLERPVPFAEPRFEATLEEELEQEPEQEMAEQPEPELLAAQAAPVAPPPGEVLLMQVWQDREGYLVVEVEGQRYRRLFDIQDGKVGRRVLEIIGYLVAFSKGHVMQLLPGANREDRPAANPPEDAIEDASQAVIEKWRLQPETSSRKPRITTDPVPFHRQKKAQERGLTLNLAEEIDQLVQVRINATPDLLGRRVRVSTAPDGGLRFEVDGVRYARLEEISDAPVQGVIQAAIKDWETRR